MIIPLGKILPAPLAEHGAAAVTAVSATASAVASSPALEEAGAALKHLLTVVVVAVGVCCANFASGIFHERVTKGTYYVRPSDTADTAFAAEPQPRRFEAYLLSTAMTGLATCVLASLAIVCIRIVTGRRVAFLYMCDRRLALTGLLLMIGDRCALYSASTLPYLEFLTLRMCKMLPSLIIGVLLFRLRYSRLKVVAVAVTSAGVLGYALLQHDAKAKMKAENPDASSLNAATHAIAVVVCLAGLANDCIMSAVHDSVIRSAARGALHPLQLLITCGLCQAGACFAFVALAEVLPASMHSQVLRPELSGAAALARDSPQAVADVAALAAFNAIAQLFIGAGMTALGVLTVMGITTTRKVGSLFISATMNGHAVSRPQAAAVLVVVAGVVLDTIEGVLSKTRGPAAPAPVSEAGVPEAPPRGRNVVVPPVSVVDATPRRPRSSKRRRSMKRKLS